MMKQSLALKSRAQIVHFQEKSTNCSTLTW